MNNWNDFKRIKPDLGQDVLIYRQGYGSHHNFYADYYVASYIKNPYDKRRYCFVPTPEKDKCTPWIYTKVTHWMPLPKPPEKINLEEANSNQNAAGWLQETFGCE